MKITSPLYKTKNLIPWLLVDFDDSFTYNIINLLLPLGIRPKVVNYRNLSFQDDFNGVLILGPGPADPDYYLSRSSSLVQYLQQDQGKIFGICLGHQLICRFFDLSVTKIPHPIHGQGVEITMPEWSLWPQRKFKVQLYNSLGVLTSNWKNLGPKVNSFFHQGQLMYLQTPNIISMQFHPESVGTSHGPEIFTAVISYFDLGFREDRL